MPSAEARAAINLHPGFQYGPSRKAVFTTVSEGFVLATDSYRFTVLETPGHTRGHLCLYEADQRILISGDHILRDITPNISLWSDAHDPLGHYLASLDKIRSYNIDLVLPSHRRLFTDCNARIAELEEHHRRRCAEALDILQDKPLTSYEVAAKMTWDLRGTWPDFPPPQKWFAAGEATAHLRYLETSGAARRISVDGQTLYAAVRPA